MASNYSCRFSPLEQIIKIRMHPGNSLKSNKDLSIIEKFLDDPDIITEIVHQFSNFSTAVLQEQKNFLENLIRKLSHKLSSQREEEDEDNVEDFELSYQESEYLNKSFEVFLEESSSISFFDEEKKVGELIPENKRNSIINIKLNVLRGFQNPETPQGESDDSKNQMQEKFKCKKHAKETTHFCKTCNKLVCSFDIFPGKDSKEGSKFQIFCTKS